MKQPHSFRPAVAAADRGPAFFTGSARRRASKSGGRPWTKPRSAGSKNTTPTSNSTGRRSSRHSRLRRRPPKTRAIAADAAIGRVPHGRHRASVPHRRQLRQRRPSVKTLNCRDRKQSNRSFRKPNSWNQLRNRNRNWNWNANRLELELEPEPDLDLDPAEIAQAFEQLTHPEAEEAVEPAGHAGRAAGRSRTAHTTARALRRAADPNLGAGRRRRAD